MFLQFLTLLQASQFSETLRDGIATGVVVIIYAVINWIRTKGWRKIVRGGVDTITTKIGELEKSIDSIKHEFELNGGGTVKAAIFQLRDDLEQLRDVQSAFATIQMNACTFPVFKCDSIGNWTFANEVLVDLFGTSYQEVMRRKWLELIPDVQLRLHVLKTFQACASDDVPFREEVTLQNQKDERLYLCEISANAFRGRSKGGVAPILFFYGRLEVLREVTPSPGD